MLGGGPYGELLQAAESLGFTVPQPSHNSNPQQQQQQQQQTTTTALDQAHLLVAKCSEVHELELRISALSAHLASKTVTDQAQLSARLAGLGAAASTLQLVLASKDAIADHLRSASIRPSVPVAPVYQPDFAALLRCAASNAAVLQDGLQVLQWAASLSDKPSCWEDQLRVIRDSAQAMQDYAHAMQEFDTQLTSSSGSTAVAAATGCGCGGGSSNSSGLLRTSGGAAAAVASGKEGAGGSAGAAAARVVSSDGA